MNKIEEGIISTKGQEMVGWEEIMDYEENIIAIIITIINVGKEENRDR